MVVHQSPSSPPSTWDKWQSEEIPLLSFSFSFFNNSNASKSFFCFFGALAGRCGFEPWRIEMAHWSVTICAAVGGWDKWIWLFDGAKELIFLAVKGRVGRFNFHGWKKTWNRHQNNQWYAHLWSSRVSISVKKKERAGTTGIVKKQNPHQENECLPPAFSTVHTSRIFRHFSTW